MKCHSIQIHNHFSRDGVHGQMLHLGGFSPVVFKNIIRTCQPKKQKAECHSVVFSARPRSSPAIAIIRNPETKPDLEQDSPSQLLSNLLEIKLARLASATERTDFNASSTSAIITCCSPPTLTSKWHNSGLSRGINQQYSSQSSFVQKGTLPAKGTPELSEPPLFHASSYQSQSQYRSLPAPNVANNSKLISAQGLSSNSHHFSNNVDYSQDISVCRKRSSQGSFTHSSSPKSVSLLPGSHRHDQDSLRSTGQMLPEQEFLMHNSPGVSELLRGVGNNRTAANNSNSSFTDPESDVWNMGHTATSLTQRKPAASSVLVGQTEMPDNASNLSDLANYSCLQDKITGVSLEKPGSSHALSGQSKTDDSTYLSVLANYSCMQEKISPATYLSNNDRGTKSTVCRSESKSSEPVSQITAGSDDKNETRDQLGPASKPSDKPLIPRVIVDDYDDYDCDEELDAGLFDPTTINNMKLSSWKNEDVVTFLQQTDCKEFAAIFEHQVSSTDILG